MSIFNELLPKFSEISAKYTKNCEAELKNVLDAFQKFEKDYLENRGRAESYKTKINQRATKLQSIDEDEVTDEAAEPPAAPEQQGRRKSSKRIHSNEELESNKRPKRSASVQATTNISKQVNLNLTQKLRREPDSTNEEHPRHSRRKKDADEQNKENTEVVNFATPVEIKEERISYATENLDFANEMLNIPIKQEVGKDDVAMPPPPVPATKSRKKLIKQENVCEESRRSTRNRKHTEKLASLIEQTAQSHRSTRASSRQTSQDETAVMPPPALAQEPRPKRTRAKKQQSQNSDVELQAEQNPIDEPPRPKRTRKAAQKVSDKAENQTIYSNEKTDNVKDNSNTDKKTAIPKEVEVNNINKNNQISSPIFFTRKAKKINTKSCEDEVDNICLDETRVINKPNNLNVTVTLTNCEMNKMLTCNEYQEESNKASTNTRTNTSNETTVSKSKQCAVVLESLTMNGVMNETVVISKDKPQSNITEDNSLLTDDNSDLQTPPKLEPPRNEPQQPTSAVKEKVQQFEEIAARITRTKTRALAKKLEEEDDSDKCTPPNNIIKNSKNAIPADVLNKMSNLIFNGKSQIPNSGTKPRANIISSVKSFIPSSASKLSAISKSKEAAAEEAKRKDREDAKKKKEALLEAKREQQKRKREDKMAAAAAAREAAEKERLAALEAAAKERLEKQAHATRGKLEKQKEAEKKKQDLARKVAETEERRKAEELLRQNRLAEEQRRIELANKKLKEEAEAKIEAAQMAKEIEKRQKEYMEKERKEMEKKLRMKQRIEAQRLLAMKTPDRAVFFESVPPVYMEDGYQYLVSDEDEPVHKYEPTWSTRLGRFAQLRIQEYVPTSHVDKMFSVRKHSPDLRQLFPSIDSRALKRTSSAVWRTPPNKLSLVRE